MASRIDTELKEKKLKHKILSIMKLLDVRNSTLSIISDETVTNL